MPSDCQLPGALPILAGNVAGFKLAFRSDAYRFDSDADGVTTWQELDAAAPPFGDGSDGNINTAALAGVTSVSIELRMESGGRSQTYPRKSNEEHVMSIRFAARGKRASP